MRTTVETRDAMVGETTVECSVCETETKHYWVNAVSLVGLFYKFGLSVPYFDHVVQCSKCRLVNRVLAPGD